MARSNVTTARPPVAPVPGGVRPVAPSRRLNPRLLIVALLVGLLLAAGILKAMSVAADRTPVLVLAGDVPAGATFTDGMFVSTPLAADGDIGIVPAAQRAEVVGKTASHNLRAHEVLRASDVSSEPPVGPGERRVGVRLDRGRFPFDLTAGTRVRVVTEKADVLYTAVVGRFSKGDDGNADIVLVVADEQADAIARDLQNGKASLVAEAAR